MYKHKGAYVKINYGYILTTWINIILLYDMFYICECFATDLSKCKISFWIRRILQDRLEVLKS